jgi:hypothetical protein
MSTQSGGAEGLEPDLQIQKYPYHSVKTLHCFTESVLLGLTSLKSCVRQQVVTELIAVSCVETHHITRRLYDQITTTSGISTVPSDAGRHPKCDIREKVTYLVQVIAMRIINPNRKWITFS